MRQDKIPQNRRHQRIRPALQKLVNPEFKSTVQGKLRPENLVLPENQKQYPHTNPQKRQRPPISALRITVASHHGPFGPTSYPQRVECPRCPPQPQSLRVPHPFCGFGRKGGFFRSNTTQSPFFFLRLRFSWFSGRYKFSDLLQLRIPLNKLLRP